MNGEVLYWVLGWAAFAAASLMPTMTESEWKWRETRAWAAWLWLLITLLAWYCAWRAGRAWR